MSAILEAVDSSCKLGYLFPSLLDPPRLGNESTKPVRSSSGNTKIKQCVKGQVTRVMILSSKFDELSKALGRDLLLFLLPAAVKKRENKALHSYLSVLRSYLEYGAREEYNLEIQPTEYWTLEIYAWRI